MADLTHEQLGWLCDCHFESVPDEPRERASRWLRDFGFGEASDATPGMLQLTPAGQALVDIALRAVNAELRSRE